MTTLQQQFASLCYHYVRPKSNPFPRILGNSVDEFCDHIRMLQKNYSMISPNDVVDFYHHNTSFENNKNILVTFDDGLSEHYEAAKILHELNVKAIFFIPTCILDEKLPANPMIIHYCVAEFGVESFLRSYKNVLEELKLQIDNVEYNIQYNRNSDNVWDKINQIKNLFKYKIEHTLSRKILLGIFQDLFLPKFPNGLEMIHLNENQIRDMIKMGHSIGTHSHTHVSIGGANLNPEDFEREIRYPKKFLEKKFDIDVFSFSYPFGEKQDCLSSADLLMKSKDYKIAFTVEDKINTKETSPLQLGRYMPRSTDTTEKLSVIIGKIFNG